MIKTQTGRGINMARVLLASMDEELVAKAIELHGKRDVYVALDSTVLSQMKALELGLGKHALVGADVDQSVYELYPAPTKKASKPKKVEAKKDEPKSE